MKGTTFARLSRTEREQSTYLNGPFIPRIKSKHLNSLVHKRNLRKNDGMQAVIARFRRCALFVAQVRLDDLLQLHAEISNACESCSQIGIGQGTKRPSTPNIHSLRKNRGLGRGRIHMRQNTGVEMDAHDAFPSLWGAGHASRRFRLGQPRLDGDAGCG